MATVLSGQHTGSSTPSLTFSGTTTLFMTQFKVGQIYRLRQAGTVEIPADVMEPVRNSNWYYLDVKIVGLSSTTISYLSLRDTADSWANASFYEGEKADLVPVLNNAELLYDPEQQ